MSQPVKASPKRNPLLLLIPGVLAVLATVLVLSLVNRSQTPAPTPTASGAIPLERLIRPDSPTVGPANAKATLVEFLDPECEACRGIHPTVKALLDKYPKDLRLVVRYLPLHSNSTLAARATEAAGEQGQYWEYQDKLYQAQSEWGEKSEPQQAAFERYAGYLNLDLNQFKTSLEKPEFLAKVERDRQDAQVLNLKGTPSFFLNGERLELTRTEDLEAAIVKVLKGT